MKVSYIRKNKSNVGIKAKLNAEYRSEPGTMEDCLEARCESSVRFRNKM